MNNLTSAEIKLASKLLEIAAETFNNHVCNDFSLSFLSSEERAEIMRAVETWNGTEDEYDPDNGDYCVDWLLMSYLSSRFSDCDRTLL